MYRKTEEDVWGMREYSLQNSVRLINNNPDMMNTPVVSCPCGELLDRRYDWYVMIANGLLLCKSCAICNGCRRHNSSANRRLVCIDGLVLCHDCLQNFGYPIQPAYRIKISDPNNLIQSNEPPSSDNNAAGKEADTQSADADVTMKSETKADANPGANPDANSPDAKLDTDSDAKPDANLGDNPDANPPDAKPDTDSDAKPDANPGAKPKSKANTKPDEKQDANQDAKSDAKSGSKSDAKSNANADNDGEVDVMMEYHRTDRCQFKAKKDERRPIRIAPYDPPSARLPDERNPLLKALEYDATRGSLEKMTCPACTKVAKAPNRYVVPSMARVYHKPCFICQTCKEPMSEGIQIPGKHFEYCTCEPPMAWCTRSKCKKARLDHHTEAQCWLAPLRPGGRRQLDTDISNQMERKAAADAKKKNEQKEQTEEQPANAKDK